MLATPDGAIEARGLFDGPDGIAGDLLAHIGGEQMRGTVVERGGALTVFLKGRRYELALAGPRMAAERDEAPSGGLAAPMPGKVVQVHARPGEAVRRGQALIVLEAMKMEHAILAPGDGRVREVRYKEGDVVPEGAELMTFEPGGP
jgi:3-methylcrotonyl-CoA carboxylase alpha subunit